MNQEEKGGMSYQDSPHKEGTYGNTATSKPSGQNISHSHREMNQDSEEQLRGRENQQSQNEAPGGQQESSNNNSL
jgi:hypothetical protein